MDQFQGRFVELLPPQRLTAELTEVAKSMLAVRGLNEQWLWGGRDDEMDTLPDMRGVADRERRA